MCLSQSHPPFHVDLFEGSDTCPGQILVGTLDIATAMHGQEFRVSKNQATLKFNGFDFMVASGVRFRLIAFALKAGEK